MEINFKKVHTGKDITISSITLLAGIGLFFVNKGLGVCIAVCGLLMLLIYKGGYKKADIVYAQLYDFCNYTYEPATEVVELKGEMAARLVSQL